MGYFLNAQANVLARLQKRARTHRVVMLAYPDAQVLDVTGPLEVFGAYESLAQGSRRATSSGL